MNMSGDAGSFSCGQLPGECSDRKETAASHSRELGDCDIIRSYHSQPEETGFEPDTSSAQVRNYTVYTIFKTGDISL